MPTTSLDTKLSWEKVLKLIPNGTQTFSKCPERYVNGVYPKMAISGDGCSFIGDDNRHYFDYVCALGATILGYNHYAINHAVWQTLMSGEVLLSLPNEKEYVLAEKLHQIIPCAKKIKFFKTGSEATSAAIKVVRAYTEKDHILACGYHGWHDWFSIVNDKRAGIPISMGKDITKFKYNDLDDLSGKLKRGNVAAVILEPVIYEEPRDGYLQSVIDLAHKHNSLVIFDEMVTGFRFHLGGAMSYFNAIPDIACFGKSMGNGHAIAALVGMDEFMRVYDRDNFFVSGTFGGELVGISAAISTITTLQMMGADTLGGVNKIWRDGNRLKNGFNGLTASLGLSEISCIGYAPRTEFRFPSVEHRALFWQECVKRGVFFGYANFITTAHYANIIDSTLGVCDESLRIVKAAWKNPKNSLEGDIPTTALRPI